MITSLKQTTDPTSWLVETVAEMKIQLGIRAGYTTEDTRIQNNITSAVQQVQQDTQLTVTATGQVQDQVWTMKLDTWPTNDKAAIYLPKGPVSSITGFSYLDSNGSSQNLVEDTDYKFNNNGDIPFLTYIGSWPSIYTSDHRESITVAYEAGMATVPTWVKDAVKTYAAYLYDYNEKYLSIYYSLIRPHRVYFDWKRNE